MKVPTCCEPHSIISFNAKNKPKFVGRLSKVKTLCLWLKKGAQSFQTGHTNIHSVGRVWQSSNITEVIGACMHQQRFLEIFPNLLMSVGRTDCNDLVIF